LTGSVESIFIDEDDQNKLVVLVRIFGWHLRVQADTWQVERIQPEFLFRPGQPVKILEGPYKTMTGTVEGVDVGLRKVRVTVTGTASQPKPPKIVEVDFTDLVRL
jgi:transcription antitermination factor NusG